jgi:hypothetical protein
LRSSDLQPELNRDFPEILVREQSMFVHQVSHDSVLGILEVLLLLDGKNP